MATINYTPPPIARDFIKHYRKGELFYDFIIGPVGSGKTTANFFKLVYMASLQAKSPVDGKRRSRCVVVRNTAPQLRDTTIASWMTWFKPEEAGTWRATEQKFTLKFADVECEVLFRPLDTPDDVARVLSLEVTFAILDEFVQIKKEIVEALSGRCGRYPSKKDGGPTNWGMWGASNPGNEDDWWYKALFGDPDQAHSFGADRWDMDAAEREIRRNERILAGLAAESTWTYFEQPSGFAEKPENIENLPANYYTNLARDKTTHWIAQFIEGQWGYSLAGKPVLATFNPQIHIAKTRLKFNPGLPLIGGLDPGMNTAMIFGQEDHFGRLLVLSELVTRDYGAKRFISDKLNPHLMQHYRNANFTISPDPAANTRTQTDERTVMDVYRAAKFNIRIATTNNQLPGRIEAMEHYTARLTENGPALLVDPVMCPRLTRALRTGWRYDENTKGDVKEVPKKNADSHPADGFSYLCQHFYRGSERIAKRKGQRPLPRFQNPYLNR
jgi:hypothetical protein